VASQRVWLITGTSSGIGRELALEALSRGEKVIATGRARSIAKLDELKAKGADIIELDVTDPIDKLHEVAKKAIAIHGRVDVLVNNAGYLLVGAIEESTPEETLDQFNTNVFGALNVTRAFLPYMREKKEGIIIFIGSLWGWTSGPYAGIYAASKWALRGISQSLNDEIKHLGLKSICIDFGFFRTSVLEADKRTPKVSRIPDYQETCDKMEKILEDINGKQPGDPAKGSKVIVDLVKGEGGAAGKKDFPISLVLGTDSYRGAKSLSEQTLDRLEEWKDVSLSTDFKE